MANENFDVIIVGGGPAGLSAALYLGRCCRRVLVCDDGQYRNAYSKSMHGFLSRDGINPAELRQIGRQDLQKYETVEIRAIKVVDATRQDGEFQIVLENGQKISSKKLLLATGLWDEWPTLKGAKELYGRSIFHCPYCDAWELRNQPLAVLGRGDLKAGELALSLTMWTDDIVLCSNGPSELSDDYRERLARKNISIREEPVKQLISNDVILEKIEFEEGETLARRAIFFISKTKQRSDLAAKLGCSFDEHGGVIVGKFEATDIAGLFVAGDTSRDVLQAIVAASEGFEAAVAINAALFNMSK